MAKHQRKNKPNATGRNPTSRFARLDHRLLESPAYRSLTPVARSLLVELVMIDNGSNNGALFLSVRDAAGRVGVSDLTCATNAFNELQSMGFIEMTKDAHFSVKTSETSRSRCWRLTFEAVKGKQGPTHEYLNRQPDPQTPARKRMERGLRSLKAFRRAALQNKMPVLDSNTMPPLKTEFHPLPVLNCYTAKAETSAFPPTVSVLHSSTHTAVTIGGEANSLRAGGNHWPDQPRQQH